MILYYIIYQSALIIKIYVVVFPTRSFLYSFWELTGLWSDGVTVGPYLMTGDSAEWRRRRHHNAAPIAHGAMTLLRFRAADASRNHTY